MTMTISESVRRDDPMRSGRYRKLSVYKEGLNLAAGGLKITCSESGVSQRLSELQKDGEVTRYLLEVKCAICTLFERVRRTIFL